MRREVLPTTGGARQTGARGVEDGEAIAGSVENPEDSLAIFVEREVLCFKERYTFRYASECSIECVEAGARRDPQRSSAIFAGGFDIVTAEAEDIRVVPKADSPTGGRVHPIQPVSCGQPQNSGV